MEVKIVFIALIALLSPLYSSAQAITDKSWTYSSIFAVSNGFQEIINVYTSDPGSQQEQIASNTMVFKADSTYSIRINNSVTLNGTWNISGNHFIMDDDTMTILQINRQGISLRGDHSYLDSTGTIKSGYIFVNYMVSYESVESIKSGAWDDPGTWSSGRVPNKTDNVIIKQPHRIVLSDGITGYCKNFLVELGAVFDCKTDNALIINPNEY